MMNELQWKLDHIAQRLWLTASAIAREASQWGELGHGFAVVADETRRLSEVIGDMLADELFRDGPIRPNTLRELATSLHYLSLNAAIEARRQSQCGKAVAIFAEDIRNLAVELMCLLGSGAEPDQPPLPVPAKPLTSVEEKICFVQFFANGYQMVEHIMNVAEVVTNRVAHTGGHLQLRGRSIPIVDCFARQGVKKDDAYYLVLKTPWAQANQTYAVAIDEPISIFYSSVGTPVAPGQSDPLDRYVRERWEAEDAEPFRFMDWPALAAQA